MAGLCFSLLVTKVLPLGLQGCMSRNGDQLKTVCPIGNAVAIE